MEYNLEKEKFTHKSKDEDIVVVCDAWIKESQTYHDKMLTDQKKSYQYYIGNQTDVDLVPPYLSPVVENRIFEGVETLVPICTVSAHEFLVAPALDEPKSKDKATALQKVLADKYEKLGMRKKLADATRHILINKFGVLKWCWDYEKDDVDVKLINPKLILIPKKRCDPHELPYKIEIQGYSRQELEDEFDVDPEDFGPAQKIDTDEKEEKKKEYQVLEIWTKDTVVWKLGDQILKKEQNPYYDFAGTERRVYNAKGKKIKETRFYNHLDSSQDPYVFVAPFNVGDGPVADRSLVEIAMPMQDAINIEKRAIENNMKQMGNSRVLIDSDAMTEEEAGEITNEPGLAIRGKGIASEGKIKFEPGTPIPNAHFSNLQHSEMVFDNIFGVHSATRGQANSKTLGQDILGRQQDFSRIDSLTRELNNAVYRIANGLVQLMKMFYTEKHTVKVLGEEDSFKLYSLTRDEIEDHIEIIVKSGSSLPMDEVSLRTEAVQLWQLGAISPITMFERLKFANPAKELERLVMWKQGQIDMETAAKLQEIKASAAASAASAASKQVAPGGGIPGVGETSSGAAPTGRKVETPRDVIARVRASLGGQAAVSAGNVAK